VTPERFPVLVIQDPIDARTWMIQNGDSMEVLHNVHAPGTCQGSRCWIHNPTAHHMRSWPLHWRNDRNLAERLCAHGVGHPDPDERPGQGVHGCDGCCVPS
jgi:hypothetical protein